LILLIQLYFINSEFAIPQFAIVPERGFRSGTKYGDYQKLTECLNVPEDCVNLQTIL
jgi:hypothetical protein